MTAADAAKKQVPISKLKRFFNGVALTAILLLTGSSAYANILFSEDFDGFPEGWSVTPAIVDPENPAWSVTTNDTLNITGASFDESYAISHPSEEGPRANQDTGLISPPINTVGSTNLRLTFSGKLVGYSGAFTPGLTNWARTILSVSVDGGTTWEDIYSRQGLPSTQSKETEVMLPQAAGHEDVRLRWRYVGSNGVTFGMNLPQNYWAIDSVVLEGTADAPFVPGGSSLIDGEDFPAAGLFSNIASAVAALKARGMSGAGDIIFEFGAGYDGIEPESVDIDGIGGLTPGGGRTLIFRPATGVTNVVTTFPDDHHLRIRVGNVMLDGRAGGSGTGRDWTLYARDCVVRVLGTSNQLPLPDVNLRNLKILSLGKGNPWTSTALDIRADIPEMVGLRIDDNVIGSVGGDLSNSFLQNGIVTEGGRHPNTGLEIRNNTFLNTAGRGLWFQGSYPFALIENNLVTSDTLLKGIDHNSNGSFFGIVYDSLFSPGTILRRNRVEGIEIDQYLLNSVNGIVLRRGNWHGSLNWTNDPVRVYNNTVLLGDRPVHDAPWPSVTGISVSPIASGDSLFEIDHNTVYLTGETAPGGSASSRAFSKQSATALKVRNNLFYNARSNGEDAIGTHYAAYIDNGSFLDIGFNNYRADGAGGILGNTANGAQAGIRRTIAEWLNTVNADRESVSVAPVFADASANLSLDPDVVTPLESGGTPLTHVTVDIQGTPRFPQMGYPEHPGFEATAPDIGAYEFGGQYVDLVPPTIRFNPFSKIGAAATFPLPPAVITDRTGVDTSPWGLPHVGWDVAPETMALTSLQFPLSGTPYTLEIVPAYEGVYSAGVGGNFETIQAAVSSIVAGVLSGDTIIELIDPGYLESVAIFPVSHNGNFLTIRPADDVEVAWTSQSVFSGPPLAIRGATHVIIEGNGRLTMEQKSNGGNALTISPAPAAGSPSWMTDGVRPSVITVSGVILRTYFNTATTGADSGSYSYGIHARGDQLNFSENIIRRAGVGMWVFGQDNTIIGNTIGGELTADYVSGGGVLAEGTGTTISNNHVFNIFTTVVGGILWGDSRVAVEHPIQVNHLGAIAISSVGDNAHISGNLVSGFGSVYGWGHHDVGIAVNGNEALLANNIVLNEASPILVSGDNNYMLRSRGVAIFGANAKVWHNSVNLFGNFDGTPPHRYDAACIAIYRSHFGSSSDSTQIDMRNNLFRNTITFPADWLESGGSDRFGMVRTLHVVDYGEFTPENINIGDLFDLSNNNLYHCTSPYESTEFGLLEIGALARYGRDMPLGTLNSLITWQDESAFFETLPEWQTAVNLDANSIDAEPLTVSNTDLTPLGASPLLQAAAPLENLTTDFTGDTRDPLAPTIGAIEEPWITSEPPTILSFEVVGGSPVTTASALLAVTAEDDGAPNS